MTLQKPVLYIDTTPDIRMIYDEAAVCFGLTDKSHLPNWLTYCGQYPNALKQLWRVAKTGFIENPLHPLVKELSMLSVSRHYQNIYCLSHHSLAALRLMPELSIEQLDEILDGDSFAYIPEKQSFVLSTLNALQQSDCKHWIPPSPQLIEVGFSTKDIEDLMILFAACTHVVQMIGFVNVPVEAEVIETLEQHNLSF